jgi:hypothetical protein
VRRQLGGIELQLRVENLGLGIPDGGDLGDLLIQRHAGDQVVDSRLNGSVSIFVDHARRSGLHAGRQSNRSPSGSAEMAETMAIADAAHSTDPRI